MINVLMQDKTQVRLKCASFVRWLVFLVLWWLSVALVYTFWTAEFDQAIGKSMIWLPEPLIAAFWIFLGAANAACFLLAIALALLLRPPLNAYGFSIAVAGATLVAALVSYLESSQALDIVWPEVILGDLLLNMLIGAPVFLILKLRNKVRRRNELRNHH
jgi:hypothetical protein